VPVVIFLRLLLARFFSMGGFKVAGALRGVWLDVDVKKRVETKTKKKKEFGKVVLLGWYPDFLLLLNTTVKLS
jgi:hypothetical protein